MHILLRPAVGEIGVDWRAIYFGRWTMSTIFFITIQLRRRENHTGTSPSLGTFWVAQCLKLQLY